MAKVRTADDGCSTLTGYTHVCPDGQQREIVYNGNYFCEGLGKECNWALKAWDPDNGPQVNRQINLVAAKLATGLEINRMGGFKRFGVLKIPPSLV